jgi:hypothetical protein
VLIDYVIELFNAAMLLIGLFSLFFLDDSDDWTDSVTKWYIVFILLTSILNFVLLVGYIIYLSIMNEAQKKILKTKLKTRILQFQLLFPSHTQKILKL